MHSQGAYLDAVSPGEVYMALVSGYSPDRIMFTGTSVRNDELKMIADANITVNIDSQSELDRLLKISSTANSVRARKPGSRRRSSFSLYYSWARLKVWPLGRRGYSSLCHCTSEPELNASEFTCI